LPISELFSARRLNSNSRSKSRNKSKSKNVKKLKENRGAEIISKKEQNSPRFKAESKKKVSQKTSSRKPVYTCGEQNRRQGLKRDLTALHTHNAKVQKIAARKSVKKLFYNDNVARPTIGLVSPAEDFDPIKFNPQHANIRKEMQLENEELTDYERAILNKLLGIQ